MAPLALLEREREQEAALALGDSRADSVGVINDAPGKCFLMHSIRFDAPSIKQVAAAEAKECCKMCRNFDYCTSFTWAPQDGGTCWLKQWTGTAVYRKGFTSGHFGRRASCACGTWNTTGRLTQPRVRRSHTTLSSY